MATAGNACSLAIVIALIQYEGSGGDQNLERPNVERPIF